MPRIAVLGAESTGKTVLVAALAQDLRAQGRVVYVVDEVLRRWCEERGRTPRQGEQLAIARAQAERIAATPADTLVLADTSALMVAVYSELLFGDRSLLDYALQQQAGYDLTLLTGLDLPWVADGIQRDGPHVRARVDALLRAALEGHGIGYVTVYGSGAQRTANALRALERLLPGRPRRAQSKAPAWRWECDKCSDPDCEHRLFSALLAQRPP